MQVEKPESICWSSATCLERSGLPTELCAIGQTVVGDALQDRPAVLQCPDVVCSLRHGCGLTLAFPQPVDARIWTL